MMTGLQTGLIDAMAAPPLYALLDRSFQVADNMLDLHWGALNAATVVRADAWARVPAELRPRLIEAARREGWRCATSGARPARTRSARC